MTGFRSQPIPAARFDLRDDIHPTDAIGWGVGAAREWSADRTQFAFVQDGPAELYCVAGRFTLGAGMYFAVPGSGKIAGGAGLLIGRLGFHGVFQIGGPIEGTGRLRYIDGCTDSLLIPPPILGDPCLNLLHIPPGTRQTAHTHPSIRVGLIVAGQGECVTPDGRHSLEPGLAFAIPTGLRHSFHTTTSDLRVIAYHPDSDFGPTHECHPMVNRTIVGG